VPTHFESVKEAAEMKSSAKGKNKTEPAEACVQGENVAVNASHAPHNQEADYSYSAPRDMWMLKYDVNEDGIGQILLPPSLSILLQSDRISIAPFAGGLLIRSM
jgi:hypothetical protein